MSNTIELLEGIGRDATLRYASPQDLARALDEMQASKGLMKAANSGKNASLLDELGASSNLAVQVQHNPHDGTLVDDDDDDVSDESPSRHEDVQDDDDEK